jgi:hypothetical protein
MPEDAPDASVPHDALLVFAKPPEPGRVKTRLSPPLSPEEAARLYAAFLADALRQYVVLAGARPEAPVAVRLCLASGAEPLAEALPMGLVPPGVSLHRQVGDGLGARMRHAFEEAFAAGAARAVVVGTDHPTLPSAFVRRALDALRPGDAGEGVRADACLGPSADGGYYLLGLRRAAAARGLLPAAFDGMTYSHPQVFAQTLRRLAAAAADDAAPPPVVLPRWYDVDTPAALRRLLADLADLPNDVAPRTRAAARALGLPARLLDASPPQP